MQRTQESFLNTAPSLGAYLATLHDFWDYWGFEPWQDGSFAGVSRRQRFVKGGLLGTIANYDAWEAIVWETGTCEERGSLWNACTALPNVMTQRYVFLLDNPWPDRQIRSLAWGFRGYIEFYAYWPNFSAHAKVTDLTGLVDLALKIEKDSL